MQSPIKPAPGGKPAAKKPGSSSLFCIVAVMIVVLTVWPIVSLHLLTKDDPDATTRKPHFLHINLNYAHDRDEVEANGHGGKKDAGSPVPSSPSGQRRWKPPSPASPYAASVASAMEEVSYVLEKSRGSLLASQSRPPPQSLTLVTALVNLARAPDGGPAALTDLHLKVCDMPTLHCESSHVRMCARAHDIRWWLMLCVVVRYSVTS